MAQRSDEAAAAAEAATALAAAASSGGGSSQAAAAAPPARRFGLREYTPAVVASLLRCQIALGYAPPPLQLLCVLPEMLRR